MVLAYVFVSKAKAKSKRECQREKKKNDGILLGSRVVVFVGIYSYACVFEII